MYLNNFHYNYNNKKLFLPMNQSRPSYLSDFIHVVQSLNSCHSETTNFNRISNTGRINQVHYHTCPSSIYLWTESPDNGPAINETTKFPPKATKSVCSLTHTYSALSQCPSSLSLSLFIPSLMCIHNSTQRPSHFTKVFYKNNNSSIPKVHSRKLQNTPFNWLFS